MQNVGYTKGQLKIQQMAFMLLAVTLFFVLVLLFYLTIKTAGLEKDFVNSEKEKAAGLVMRLASSPEFVFEGGSSGIKGVDADKIMVLKDNSKYKEFWGVEGIIIKKLYPPNTNTECTQNNYPNCNLIKVFTTKKSAPTGSYIALCRKESVSGNSYDRCELALLMIETKEVEKK